MNYDTPATNSAAFEEGGDQCEIVPADFARNVLAHVADTHDFVKGILERERDEARRIAQELRDDLWYSERQRDPDHDGKEPFPWENAKAEASPDEL